MTPVVGAALATVLWVGSQVGASFTATSPPVRLQYTAATYVADGDGRWLTTRLRLDADLGLRAGEFAVYAGYSWLDHAPLPPQTWHVSYDSVLVGARTDWLDLAWRPDGWDVRVEFTLSPSLRIGFENWRWTNACSGCEWSGIYLAIR